MPHTPTRQTTRTKHQSLAKILSRRASQLLFAILTLTFATSAVAETRMALVIGNAAYSSAAPLPTPVQDATDIAAALKQLGFEVTLATDLDGRALVDTMATFTRQLAGADVALLYLAGHGLQFRGENYFLPIDATLRNEFSVRREAFPIQDLIEHMDNRAGVNLVFLDAARQNPIADGFRNSLTSGSAAATGQSRSKVVGTGLGIMPSLRGETLLVYAAEVGALSKPATGRNSPFASALLEHVASPSIEIEVMLKRVTGTVRRLTNNGQRPQRLSRLTSEFYFNIGETTDRANDVITEQNEQDLAALNDRINSLKEELAQKAKSLPIPDVVSLPGGLFLMGCVSGRECQDDEKPVHAVKISPFLIARHETTFAQWDACVEDGGCMHRPKDENWGRDTRPVINVSWRDAQDYARWLSRKTGQQWRLPSEAEWEYAARAGSSTSFAFGNSLTSEQANFGFTLKQSTPVGSYPPNAFGLHDMHGNVWEWVADRYAADYYSRSPVADPAGPDQGMARVFRGGSWMYNARNLRSADRNNYAPEFRSRNLGFRLVRTP